MSSKNNPKQYALNAKDLQLLDKYANIPSSDEQGMAQGGVDKVSTAKASAASAHSTLEAEAGFSDIDIMSFISRLVLADEHDEFVAFIQDCKEELADICESSPSLKGVIELGFRYFISNGSDVCACNFGALFYCGTIFEQDYERAKELYELAVNLGNEQALINLGYIYEYGRIGKPDYAKAYDFYSKAAALMGNFESLYKLGDMYSRGRGIEPDLHMAFSLWYKSYDVSESRLEKGHAAFRMAKVLISEDATKYGVKQDLLSALILFQEAEISFRLEIENGAYYYEKNMVASIEGQKEARLLLGSLE